MNRTVIWSKRAKSQRKEILKYWIIRNNSITYSTKLNILIGMAVNAISIHPNLGRETEIENVRQKIIKTYKLFYKVNNSTIFIVALVNMKRNPSTIRKMLE